MDHIPTITGLVSVDVEALRLDRRIRQSASKLASDPRLSETSVIAAGMLRSFQQEQALVEETAALRARMDVLAGQAAKAAEEQLRDATALAQERERTVRLEAAARAAEERRLRAEDRARCVFPPSGRLFPSTLLLVTLILFVIFTDIFIALLSFLLPPSQSL